MWLSFLGAAGTVTGSRFLVDTDGTALLAPVPYDEPVAAAALAARVRAELGGNAVVSRPGERVRP